MTAERFSFFLKNPDQLIQISYQELKSLVVQYPYCQNLRYLLMAKSQIENSNEMEKDLHLAATYSADRSYLYKLLNDLKGSSNNGENFILNEDYLELKNISTTSEENLIPTAELGVLGAAAASSLNFSQKDITAKVKEKTEEPIEEAIETQLEEAIETQLEEALEEIEQKEEIQIETKEEVDVLEKLEETEVEVEQAAEPEVEVSEPVSAEEEPVAEEKELETENLADNDSDNEEPSTETDEENIPDNSEITYMEKPKHRKSVIDQLLKRVQPVDQEITENDNISDETDVKNIINLADELESVPEPKENFMDLSPVKEKPILGREVLFEITNKTDKEMDALRQKTSEENIQPDEPPQNQNIVSMNHLEEETKQPLPSTPAPKTSFKSYIEQFQPPGMMEDLEEEKELNNILEEVVEEEIEDSKPKAKKDKKVKKKKKKSEDKIKKVKSKKNETKEKKKKKKKDKIKKVVDQSVEENEDVASETLAELLGKQGSRKKAIQMYKRLSLIFPKKSSFFAKKIEKLKK